jgi:hypothetical protein
MNVDRESMGTGEALRESLPNRRTVEQSHVRVTAPEIRHAGAAILMVVSVRRGRDSSSDWHVVSFDIT